MFLSSYSALFTASSLIYYEVVIDKVAAFMCEVASANLLRFRTIQSPHFFAAVSFIRDFYCHVICS